MQKILNKTMNIDSQLALDLLKEGNARFVSGDLIPKDDYAILREKLSVGQHPFAVVLCCSDSRVAPEIIFDQKLGDLFVIRNAGNIVDEEVLGSIEYAVEHLETPLVVNTRIVRNTKTIAIPRTSRIRPLLICADNCSAGNCASAYIVTSLILFCSGTS